MPLSICWVKLVLLSLWVFTASYRPDWGLAATVHIKLPSPPRPVHRHHHLHHHHHHHHHLILIHISVLVFIPGPILPLGWIRYAIAGLLGF